MFDIGWVEIGLIAVVALIVIGPKDLPAAMRTLTGIIRKMRGMMREFQSGVDDLVREAELKELRDEVEKSARDGLGDLDPMIDPTGGYGDPFESTENEGAATSTVGDAGTKKLESGGKDANDTGGTDEAADAPDAKPKAAKASAKPAGKSAKSTKASAKTKTGLTKNAAGGSASKAKA